MTTPPLQRLFSMVINKTMTRRDQPQTTTTILFLYLLYGIVIISGGPLFAVYHRCASCCFLEAKTTSASAVLVRPIGLHFRCSEIHCHNILCNSVDISSFHILSV